EPKPFAGATHVFDVAQPGRPERWASGAKAPEHARYLGACEAVTRLEHMLGNFELDMLDEDVRIAREFSPGQRMTVLRQFMSWWGDHPPQPERQLIRLEGGMRVAHGFHTICQTIPHVVARAERDGAGGATGAALEIEDNEEMEPPETWPEHDAGLHVVHAHAGPNVGAWAEVGELTAIRIHDHTEWWLAAIRRLAPGPQNILRAEFEVLSKKPFGAWLRVMGREETSAANWQAADGFAFEYIQGIILTDWKVPGQAGTIIVPKSKFVPQEVLELLHGGKSRLLRLTEFREQGKDFDWCVFEWA
ncbi:MAG TPA: hypothetical protein VFV17_08260, partial [Usitatibacteraceae bacterium]|nr:hypothetical protein [Usitatibacteraceae bacterium]